MKLGILAKEARLRKADWHNAVIEGRVVRIVTTSVVGSQISARSYLTVQEAETALAKLLSAGFNANIVRV